MLADTLLLLRLYWKIDRRADRGTRVGSRIALVVVLLAVTVLSGLIGGFAGTLANGMAGLQIRADLLPGVLLTLVMFGVVFVGFSQSLQTLYLSDDMDKLLVAPIQPQAVMTAKLLSRLPSFVLFLVLGTIPALVAFGLVVDFGLFYYLVGLLLILVTPLFGISLGALVAIFMVRLLPARRLNEWVGAASIVIGVLLSMLAFVPSLMGGNMPEMQPGDLAEVEDLLNHMGDMPLPSTWAGSALVEFGQGEISATALGAVGFYLLLTVGLFVVTVVLANRLFLAGWLRMQSSGSETASLADVQERPGLFGRNSLDLMLSYKDWLMRVRDPRLLATLFVSVVAAGFFLVMLFGSPGGFPFLSPPKSGNQNLLSPGVFAAGLVYILGYMAFYNLGVTALSIERQTFYILKVAPVSASQVFRAKILGVYLPYVILSTIALGLFWFVLDLSSLWTPYGWLVLIIMGYGLYSYIVSMSFLYPSLDWDDPRRMQNRKSGMPAFFGTALYSIVLMVFAVLVHFWAVTNPAWAIPIVILGLAVMAGLTWFFVHWSAMRVEKVWPSIAAG